MVQWVILALSLQAAPLPRAHAHNDYAQPKPLVGAMSLGFCSIEADVFLVDGNLLVAHDRKDVKPERELEAMYLRPLWEATQRHGGTVYPRAAEVLLLVDVKADGTAAYRALDKILEPYRPMLTSYRDGKVTHRAVAVVLSGDRPIEAVAAEKERWVSLDGRPGDSVPRAKDPTLFPLVSSSWLSHFRWLGAGEMPDVERERLREMVSRTHGNGQRLRFWATPDIEPMWKLLLEEGIDLIGTDRQPELARFLSASK